MPLTERTCRLCDLHTLRAEGQTAWDRVILESEHFVAVPSKGSLVPGWTLIVPKHHCLSFSSVPTSWSDELTTVIRRVEAALEAHFAPPTFFEHGAVSEHSAFGCGVDHAHVHAVPLSFDLEELSRNALAHHWFHTDPPWLRPAGRAYVTVRGPRDQRWTTSEPEALPRQFFRQVIARALGLSEYHYDKAPRPEVARETVRRLTPSLA